VKVPFICRDCGEEKEVWPHQVKPDWPGRCGDCSRRRGHVRRKSEDVELPTGSVALYSRRKGNRVPVKCGLCSEEHEVHRKQIGGRRGKNFTGYCLTHTAHEIATLLLAKAQNGNGQKNVAAQKEKLPRKPRVRIKTVLDKTLNNLNDSILKVYDARGANSLVTVELVADDAGLGSLSHGDGGARNVIRLLRRNDIQDTFPVYRDKLIAERRSGVKSHAIGKG
jgi:hypothetical protein